MNTVVPITIVISLGAGSAWLLRRWIANAWIASTLAGLAATALWGLGTEALFRLICPDQDMGATHYEGILIVFLVASSASFATWRLTPGTIRRMTGAMNSDHGAASADPGPDDVPERQE